MRTIEGIHLYLATTPLERLCNALHDSICENKKYIVISSEGVTASDHTEDITALHISTSIVKQMFDSESIRKELLDYFNNNVGHIKDLYKSCLVLV